MSELDYRQEWMTDDQWRAAQLLACVFSGFHNMRPIRECGNGVAVTLYQCDLSTFDFSQLTQIVVLAHQRCIRVSICLYGMHLEARAYARDPNGARFDNRHPSWSELCARVDAECGT
ncbi:hypothetical protein UFOVP141_22 [uncultured Caudovirales phage]|uniref:Uncharacterized protein n=1 Tax=uncultured Caudovirales phage TaxID=2100421 RepID=A0A6J7VP70_9CAUD|nr:hypothetical protein UFOVP141_22 [uncultured Caudovirales phage]